VRSQKLDQLLEEPKIGKDYGLLHMLQRCYSVYGTNDLDMP